MGDDAQSWQERLHIAPGNMGTVTYEDAAKMLGLSYSRIAALVSSGELHAIKVPHDARKRLRSDELIWYDHKRQGEDAGQNPVLRMQEALAAAEAHTQVLDTLTELRRYVAEHMAASSAASQLNAALTEIAQHLAGTLVRDTLGLEPLPAEERVRLSALLAALTKRGGDTR